MKITGGKRGKQEGVKGFTIKTINGKDYLYVWGELDHERTNQERKGNKTKTAFYKWQSLGRYGKSETWEKLMMHLESRYGINQDKEDELNAFLEKVEEEFENHQEKKQRKAN